MTNIKNRVTVINLTLLILLGAMTPTNAQTSIAVQESRLDSLNDLSYEIKLNKSKIELIKSKIELAKLKKRCLENNGCEKSNAVKPLNALSISAIINNRVAFKDIEGTFQPGDMLGDSGIKIISITDSSVVLSTANNLNKTRTLTMDWTND